ncbi:early placenta insulin-like peptide [Octodon degus]|uniref:Early placenta insulin-like peptide n=1 Tax=Octodon degus TaxID=10160 RepID=A0A6P6EZI3_OCTDE|nr:early placenta insulin-like peptide [Octodon degus]
MFGLLWSHLPIVWLMLSQFLREGSPQWVNDEKIKICGDQFDDYVIVYCLGSEKIISKIQMDQSEESESLTKTARSSIDKDAGTFDMVSEFMSNAPRDSVYEGQPPLWKDLLVQLKRTISDIIKLCCEEGCDKKTFLEVCTMEE